MFALHFGAGNIGRGFIGYLLARSGHQVTFVDVNPELVRLIQERGRYSVHLLGAEQRVEWVEGVSALDGREQEVVAAAVARADLVTTSVGAGVLPRLAPAIADGLRRRGGRPLHIIACENMIGASAFLRDEVLKLTGGDALGAAFPNAVVDRIVPPFAPTGEDPLAIGVEPYCEWLVEEEAFVADVPPVEGMKRVANLGAFVERKLFGLNMGHAVIAYLGYLRGHRLIGEAIADPFVRAGLYGALVEAGLTLCLRHGFSEAEQARYAATTISRFENPALVDPVTRVGREPARKLGPQDRLVRPALLALEAGIIPRCLARAIAAAFLFDPAEDPGAVALAGRARAEGLAPMLTEVCGLPADSLLRRLVEEEYALLRSFDESA
ncbi:mannitol-1-phosphate 5-dehydrogenase [Symbiobacterium terraclitae]|uniref:Mannitol-1-phosphate 5-dehydrogenase n=1 Tax=Symbiobacterium terraclitae TaxID=557451 RepID=A0ABS4JNS3_9FIRM|nr:mannitol-1-phosphate 5-dehydrogenase [Symbiobacterium terraclitae]MBP2016635.1 mannitol-1-phosphate 5-dehydrogenase [Symbiobacterium terraclitae]